MPEGDYKEAAYEIRQVIDIEISRVVTEYRAQILENANGKKFTAPFPDGVNRPVQYGANLKAHSVYMSQYQLIPYNRIEEHFLDQAGIKISSGSLYNFNKETYEQLEIFDKIVKRNLTNAFLCHADETGININGKRLWLHCISNDDGTYFFPHEKRGTIAMDEMGILPYFKGVLCHDHWKPYFQYDCIHSLCNAHHLRELERAWEQDNQKWARDIRKLLLEMFSIHDRSGYLLSNTKLSLNM